MYHTTYYDKKDSTVFFRHTGIYYLNNNSLVVIFVGSSPLLLWPFSRNFLDLTGTTTYRNIY